LIRALSQNIRSMSDEHFPDDGRWKCPIDVSHVPDEHYRRRRYATSNFLVANFWTSHLVQSTQNGPERADQDGPLQLTPRLGQRQADIWGLGVWSPDRFHRPLVFFLIFGRWLFLSSIFFLFQWFHQSEFIQEIKLLSCTGHKYVSLIRGKKNTKIVIFQLNPFILKPFHIDSNFDRKLLMWMRIM